MSSRGWCHTHRNGGDDLIVGQHVGTPPHLQAADLSQEQRRIVHPSTLAAGVEGGGRRFSGDIAYPPTTGAQRLCDVVVATDASLARLGELVQTAEHPIEIVRWPASGWRPVDVGSGDRRRHRRPVRVQWRGETLYARNNAVGDSYLFGWSTSPEAAANDGAPEARDQALIWRADFANWSIRPTGESVVPLRAAATT